MERPSPVLFHDLAYPDFRGHARPCCFIKNPAGMSARRNPFNIVQGRSPVLT
jgi:hypothetical protein